ncbi:unnamed protein product [Symbiodinium sp. CCMP2456]|nr:unnamed protein product [Symbiodinium sp. CCMP2456]
MPVKIFIFAYIMAVMAMLLIMVLVVIMVMIVTSAVVSMIRTITMAGVTSITAINTISPIANFMTIFHLRFTVNTVIGCTMLILAIAIASASPTSHQCVAVTCTDFLKLRADLMAQCLSHPCRRWSQKPKTGDELARYREHYGTSTLLRAESRDASFCNLSEGTGSGRLAHLCQLLFKCSRSYSSRFWHCFSQEDSIGLLKPICVECNHDEGFERRVLTRVQLRTWGELCMPVCPHTGRATEEPCNTSCFVESNVPIKYPEYISHRSLAWKQGKWVPSPATVDKFVREGGEQWSATFECWDFQTGPVGFPICDGSDPRNWPDEVGVWQVVACPDGEIDPPPVPRYSNTIQTSCANLSDTCMDDLTWAMKIGIFQAPDWYPGLKFNSTPDEFQMFIHTVLGSCPPPCSQGPYFEPVDGGVNRVCRGLTPEDNSNSYFTVRVANSTDACKQLCADSSGCRGVEYAAESGRCEIWLREGGIEASNKAFGFECWRYIDPNGSSGPPVTTTLLPHQLMYFQGFDGVAKDRVCRGANPNDNSWLYYDLYWTSTLQGCQSQCIEVAGCKGVEYAASIGRCEVWTKPEGIQAVRVSAGNDCWLYAPPGTGVGTIDAW